MIASVRAQGIYILEWPDCHEGPQKKCSKKIEDNGQDCLEETNTLKPQLK